MNEHESLHECAKASRAKMAGRVGASATIRKRAPGSLSELRQPLERVGPPARFYAGLVYAALFTVPFWLVVVYAVVRGVW